MPQWAIDRVLRRRGRLHCHADLDPRRTALVVIDMQNFFVGDTGAAGGVSAAGKVPNVGRIIPNINRLARTIRETGGKVFWVKHAFTEQVTTEWSNWLAMALPERRAALEELRPGTQAHELSPELGVAPGDEVVLKQRYSAFIQGSSTLPSRLTASGLDTVIVAGTLTNVCCDASARDAMMLNFKAIMVSDANASITKEEHLAALASFYASFGDVMSTDELIHCLRRSTTLGRATD